MRKKEKEQARLLRGEGVSYKEIVKVLGVARSSVSMWVRDIKLSQDKLQALKERQHTFEVIEKRRVSRLRNASSTRRIYLHEGLEAIERNGEINLMILGIGIYLGEGSKTDRGKIALSNTDPRIIQIFVKFLTDICGYPLSKVHAHIGIHSHLSIKNAEQYWAKISGIPLKQFSKTSIQASKAGKGERDRLPFGTFEVSVYDTPGRIRLEGWIQGVYQKLFPSQTELHSMTKLRI